MKSKTFLILLALGVVLAAATYLISKPGIQANTKKTMGQALLADLPINDIRTIELSSVENRVVLKKNPEIWVVNSHYDYPADFSKIFDLAKKIKAIKIGRSFKGEADILARLGLATPAKDVKDPAAAGLRLKLADKDGKQLVDLVLAHPDKTNSAAAAYYVRKTDSNQVYQVDKNFKFIERTDQEWMAARPFEVDAEQIFKVDCRRAGDSKPLFTLQRPEKGKDPVILDAPAGVNVDKSKVDQVFAALGAFEIEDVEVPGKHGDAATDDKRAYVFDYAFYDGTVFSVKPLSRVAAGQDRFLYRVTVTWDAKAAQPSGADSKQTGRDAKQDADTDKVDKKADDPAAQAEALNKRIGQWTYVVSQWVNDAFINDRAQLFKKDEKPSS